MTARQSLPLGKAWSAWGGDIERLTRVVSVVEAVAAERLAPLARQVEEARNSPNDGGSAYAMTLSGAEYMHSLAGWRVEVQATDKAGVEHTGTWPEVRAAIDAEAMTALTVGARSTEPAELSEQDRGRELPWETGAHVKVEFSEAKGVSYQVRGHPSWARDAASRIETELKTRVPWWHPIKSDGGWGLLGGALSLVLALLWGTTGALFSGNQGYGAQVLVVFVVSVIPMAVLVGQVLRLFPRFEVTSQEQKPKGTRNINYAATLLLGALVGWVLFKVLG